MARHTAPPRQLPLSGEGAWASLCARSGPNLPQPVHTLPQWTAAAMESMGGTARPEYIPPSCMNDCYVWLVAQLYLPPPDSIFVIAPSPTTTDPSATATSAATTFVASSSPDATEGSADHFSAPAPPAAEDTTATDAPTTETPTAPRPPPFHVPEAAEDGALAASSSPGVALDTAGGVTAAAASVTETDLDVKTDLTPAVTAPPTADDTTATAPAAQADHADGGRPRKRRRKRESPAETARRRQRLQAYAPLLPQPGRS